MILPREQRLLLTLGLAVLAYAVLRYHIIKNVPWEHLPLYTTNKVFAVVGLAGLVGSRLAAGRERHAERRAAVGAPPETLIGASVTASRSSFSTTASLLDLGPINAQTTGMTTSPNQTASMSMVIK